MIKNQKCPLNYSTSILEYRTTRERVIQTIEKKKAARERKRKERKAAQVAAALAEAARIQSPNIDDAETESQQNSVSKSQLRLSREEAEDQQLRMLLGQDIETTENGTLRRKKKHHHRYIQFEKSSCNKI